MPMFAVRAEAVCVDVWGQDGRLCSYVMEGRAGNEHLESCPTLGGLHKDVAARSTRDPGTDNGSGHGLLQSRQVTTV
jgi:hypothetical protein